MGFLINPYVFDSFVYTPKAVTANGDAQIRDGLGKTVTVVGNAQIDTAQYKVGSSSGYSDGAGDYIYAASSSDFDFSSGAFTIQFWVRPSTLNGNTLFSRVNTSPSYQGYYFHLLADGSAVFRTDSDTARITSSTGLCSVGTWTHIALVSDGTTVELYVDGTSEGTWTGVLQNYSTTFNVFGNSLNSANVHIDEFEVAKGIERYTTDFTPSTTPLVADAYTKLLLHFEGSDAATLFTDSSVAPKIGSGCVYLDGTGDYLSVPDSADWTFGTGDFTIRFKVRFSTIASTGTQIFATQRVDASNFWNLNFNTSSGTQTINWNRQYSGSGSNITFSISGLVVDTWYDFQLSRDGTTLRLFIDGVQKDGDKTESTDLSDLATPLWISRSTAGVFGYLDELEISKGIARNTSGFTPSTDPITPDSYTKLLLHFEGTNGSTTFTDG